MGNKISICEELNKNNFYNCLSKVNNNLVDCLKKNIIYDDDNLTNEIFEKKKEQKMEKSLSNIINNEYIIREQIKA